MWKTKIDFKINDTNKIWDIKEFWWRKYILWTDRKWKLKWQELSNLAYN